VEAIHAGINCAGIYSKTGQSLEYQSKVFEEIAAGFTKILFATAEKFDLNPSFRAMLKRIYETKGLRFKIMEKPWTIETAIPNSPIMLLTATCSLQDASSICESLQIPLRNLTIFRKEVVEGKIIIYCATPDSCEGIYDELTKKLKSISISMYHGNIGNMIQEIGRAARDKHPAKSVLFYSRGDIWSVYSIASSGRE
ncbi:15794_t:CDS:2, partial [Entrophospora sp. SA101]